mmetsp:Transcript_21230/g.42520  ORF Transcript_21230/g.42520 Transcript_21230/m.42520 type:complete len:266 (+) Transcript_21230:860-1657(+)
MYKLAAPFLLFLPPSPFLSLSGSTRLARPLLPVLVSTLSTLFSSSPPRASFPLEVPRRFGPPPELLLPPGGFSALVAGVTVSPPGDFPSKPPDDGACIADLLPPPRGELKAPFPPPPAEKSLLAHVPGAAGGEGSPPSISASTASSASIVGGMSSSPLLSSTPISGSGATTGMGFGAGGRTRRGGVGGGGVGGGGVGGGTMTGSGSGEGAATGTGEGTRARTGAVRTGVEGMTSGISSSTRGDGGEGVGGADGCSPMKRKISLRT